MKAVEMTHLTVSGLNDYSISLYLVVLLIFVENLSADCFGLFVNLVVMATRNHLTLAFDLQIGVN